jgi:heat shock protein HtpX
MLVLGIVASLLGVNHYLTANGLNLGALLGFAMVMGFGGAFISLLISKPMAKWSTGAQVIDRTTKRRRSLVARHREKPVPACLAYRCPRWPSMKVEPNAFATGAFRNSALVAVSTGLLQGMTREEVEAVLAHEVAHVQNGDMVTLTLVQGVLNTFVVFSRASRLCGRQRIAQRR